MRYATCVIDASFDGRPLLYAIREQIGISRKSLRHTKYVPDAILLDERPARTDDIAYAGTRLSVAISDADIAATPSSVEPERGPLDVLYQDEDLLVVNKPAGMVVHPRVGHTSGTLANFAAGYLAEQGLSCGCHPAHRLDQGTSGAIVFTLNGYAQAQLQRQLHKTFQREYLAICNGWIEEPENEHDGQHLDVLLDRLSNRGQEPDQSKNTLALPHDDERWRTIDAPIGRRSDRASTTFAVVGDAPCEEGFAKDAVTHFKALSHFESDGRRLSLVRLKLETGRTHQIRVHMAHIGHPLLGDALYGSDNELRRPALHSWRISFVHPLNGKGIRLEAPLPRDLQNILCAISF